MRPFPMGVSTRVQIRSYYERNIKGAFTALFIRSAHKRRFTVLTLPYTLFFFFRFFLFFFSPLRAPAVRFRWPSSIGTIEERRRIYRVSRSKWPFVSMRYTPEAPRSRSNNIAFRRTDTISVPSNRNDAPVRA